VGFNYRLTELQAAIAREQIKKLPALNRFRVELVETLCAGIKDIDFLNPIKERINSESTFYVFPLRFSPDKAGVSRDDFVKAVNAEGIMFYQGYVKPLYYQPLYQQKCLFKNGYPFTAQENSMSNLDYSEGICPNAEKLYFSEMVINEHIRLPNTVKDINDIIIAIEKVSSDER